jgi:hypothetical protein
MALQAGCRVAGLPAEAVIAQRARSTPRCQRPLAVSERGWANGQRTPRAAARRRPSGGRVRPASAGPARRGRGVADLARPALAMGGFDAGMPVSLGHWRERTDLQCPLMRDPRLLVALLLGPRATCGQQFAAGWNLAAQGTGVRISVQIAVRTRAFGASGWSGSKAAESVAVGREVPSRQGTRECRASPG